MIKFAVTIPIKNTYFHASIPKVAINHPAMAKFNMLKKVNVLEKIIAGIVLVEPTGLSFTKP